MILDARAVADGSELDADVCIVGAGPAGITIADALNGSALRVVVLESGGLRVDAATQDLARGEVTGHAYPALEAARLRVFGGTSAHWNGWCRPLDAVDFERREGVPNSGWPIRLGDLEGHYRRAQRICELGPLEYGGRYWARVLGARPLPLGEGPYETSVFQFSPPTRFGEAYREPLDGSRNVRVLLHANVTEIVTEDGGRAVERVLGATLSGRSFAVRARTYVLACGGIENARLLLASRIAPATPVGRFFGEHPHSPVAVAALPANIADVYLRTVARDVPVRAAVATSPSLAHEGLLRTSVTLEPLAADPYIDHDDERERHLASFGGDVASVAASLERSQLALYALYMRGEQAPNASSRVTLADDRDRLGVRRARLEWRLGELDRESTGRAVALLGRTLGRLGIGRLYSRPAADDGFWGQVAGGFHHMGTTRMGDDPRTSVVDRDCRVHGVGNLYVGGSSTFATTGYANPTLTIVALALRLADALKERA